MSRPEELNILECTVRDGNYAVDFKFTELDTALLAAQLDRLGFRWIEVGHGLGLGGSRAGKGQMTASDTDFIRAAKQASPRALIGSFFIPGIGTLEDMKAARDAGLDFIRIGQDATAAEKTFPFIEQARKIGLVPCLNLMKSYALSYEEFADKGRGAVDAGVEIIYCVDSAGSMLPENVSGYLDATAAVVECKLGFHGHNNLMLAVVNCITAMEHGASFLDSTLTGLGRSAGNAPSEILIAVLERMGIHTGIDLFEVMDVIERYIWPLVKHVRPHDMVGIASGYSQFHSSFLPKVLSAAQKHNADLRRLIARVALHDPVNLDAQFLSESAQNLAGSASALPTEELLSFNVPGIAPQHINSSLDSAERLIKGLEVCSAKRIGSVTALMLTPSELDRADDFLLVEFLSSDPSMQLGKVTFGSLDVLEKVVELSKSRISLFILCGCSDWSEEAVEIVRSRVGLPRMMMVDEELVKKVFLKEVFEFGSLQGKGCRILMYCVDDLVLEAFGEIHGRVAQVCLYGRNEGMQVPVDMNITQLERLEDCRQGQTPFDMIICGENPVDSDIATLKDVLDPQGKIIVPYFSPAQSLSSEFSERLIRLDDSQGHYDLLGRHRTILDLFRLRDKNRGELTL